MLRLLTPSSGNNLGLPGNFIEVSAFFNTSEFNPNLTPQQLEIAIPSVLLRASLQRQAEFIAGRYVASVALRTAGYRGSEKIRVRNDRSPQWPRGYVGSITHTPDGFVSAVIARVEDLRSLGRDTERLLDRRTVIEIERVVLRPREFALRVPMGLDWLQYVTLLFSAKESLYKALFPLCGRFFEFQDAEAIWISENLIQFRLAVDLGGEFGVGFECQARFQINAPYIHTGVEIE